MEILLTIALITLFLSMVWFIFFSFWTYFLAQNISYDNYKTKTSFSIASIIVSIINLIIVGTIFYKQIIQSSPN